MQDSGKNNISPHIYVITVSVIASLSFLIFRKTGHHEEYFFLPMLCLGVVYGIINMLRQRRGYSHFTIEKKIRFSILLKKSIARYLVWLVIIYGAYKFYETHTLYKNFEKNIVLFSYFFKLYTLLGLPYFFITLICKSSGIEDFYDPAVRIIHILKQIAINIFYNNKKKKGSPFRVLQKEYNRKVLLNLIMRAYFIPVMVGQIYSTMEGAIRHSANGLYGSDFFTICLWITAMLWMMDVLNASLSYCIESRWIENRSRSIDLTAGGWLVCLACYAPINNITGALFPFAPFVANNYPDSILFNTTEFLYFLKVLEIMVLVAHVYTDVSIGLSVTNITFKKLQTRGPYGIIRHPGTTFKLLLWWVQSVFYTKFWSFNYLYGHLMWNVLYILRALTEERHLTKFKEYREYKKKVRYRFIPGII